MLIPKGKYIQIISIEMKNDNILDVSSRKGGSPCKAKIVLFNKYTGMELNELGGLNLLYNLKELLLAAESSRWAQDTGAIRLANRTGLIR